MCQRNRQRWSSINLGTIDLRLSLRPERTGTSTSTRYEYQILLAENTRYRTRMFITTSSIVERDRQKRSNRNHNHCTKIRRDQATANVETLCIFLHLITIIQYSTTQVL